MVGIGDADRVERVVGERGPGVALDAAALAEEDLEAALRRGIDRGRLTGDEPVERRVAAHELAHVSGDRLAVVREDAVHDGLVRRGHRVPRGVARLSGGRETRSIGGVRIERAIERDRADGVVLGPVRVPEAVRDREARALHDLGVLGDGERQRPLRVEAAAPVRPAENAESTIDSALRVP